MKRILILIALLFTVSIGFGQRVQVIKGTVDNGLITLNKARVVLLVDDHYSIEATTDWSGNFEIYFVPEEGVSYSLSCKAQFHRDKVVSIKPPKKGSEWYSSNVRLRSTKDYVFPGGYTFPDYEAWEMRSEVH